MRGIVIRAVLFMSISIGVFFLLTRNAASTDPPHPTGSCGTCHTLHNAQGIDLLTCGQIYSPTNAACIENLCISCHNNLGPASGKPFSESMIASPGERGTSHSWNGVMPATSSPSNPYGLRSRADIANEDIKDRLIDYGNVIACTVCHDPHVHLRKPWDPASSQTYTRDVTNDRHFQRADNEYNQVCIDCHYYRAMDYVRAKGGDPQYVPDGVKMFSHPVGVVLNSLGYDRTAPLDANGDAQTGPPRYYGDVDGNTTNDLVLGADGRIHCMSCHRPHYTDSNSQTEDVP